MRRLVIPSAIVLLALMPGIAAACSIAVTTMVPGPRGNADVRRPIEHEGTRGAWKLGAEWKASRPELLNQVALRSGTVTALLARQNTVAVDVPVDLDERGGYIVGDTNEQNAPCALTGKPDWERPTFLVRETDRAVFITSVARPTQGDRTGCIVSEATAVTSCEDTAVARLKLKRPIGDRRLVLSTFA